MKYIQKHPKLSDILKHFNLNDYFELYNIFSQEHSIEFSDYDITSNTDVTLSPNALAEFDNFKRKNFQFWIPTAGSVIAFFRPEIFTFINWIMKLLSEK